VSERIPRLAPAPRLALAVALLAPLWLLALTPLGGWPAAIASLALFFAAVWDAASMPGNGSLQLSRELPPVVGLGDRAEGTLRLRSSWPRALRGELYERSPSGFSREGPSPVIFIAESEVTVNVPLPLVGRTRGVHQGGPIAIRLTGPLGLVRRTLRWTFDDRLTVAPSLSGVRRYRLLALQHRLRDVGVRAIRRRGENTAFDRLREYVRGDDPRHIDWKASGRRGTLVTREFTIEQGQTVMLAIDCGRLMSQLAGDLPRLEYALAAALVVADVAAAGDDRIGLIAFDDRIRAWVPPARGRAAVRAVRDALVPLESRLVEPDYAGAFRTLAARHRKRSLLLLFTDVVDARASRPLIANLTRAAATHLPVVVTMRNEALVSAAASGRESGDVWRRAAAEELLGERESALAALRSQGIAVLDVPPVGMTAAVINRYIEIKARGAL
jgi:uncharacterized protein (DUF58 family)